MSKKKTLIVVSIAFLIVMATLFVSYGFITSIISGNETSKKAMFNGQMIKVEYSDGTETLSSNQGVFTPGSTITKTFTIKNTGNISVKYSINLDNITNTFTRKSDITYELSNNDTILKNGMYEATGIFPENKLTILNKDILRIGESKTYTLKITYLNSNENQIIDSGSSISAKIVIEEAKVNINKLIVYGNSIQDGTPSPTNPVAIESLGSKTSNILEYPYETSEKTSAEITWKLNDDRSISVSGTATGYSMFVLKNNIQLEVGKKYYFKASGTYSGVSLIFAYYDETGTRKYNGNGIVWSAEYTNPEIYLQVNPDITASGKVYPYVVSEQYKDLDYEPFDKYKVTIKLNEEILSNIYLDEPLRKVGEYKDYIDFDSSKLIRRIGKQLFTGNEEFDSNLMTNALTYVIDNKIGGNTISNYFNSPSALPVANERYWGNIYMSSIETSGLGFLMVNSPYNKETFKQYLKTQHENSNAIEVNYVYKTNEEKKIELPIIFTNIGTNIIEICSDNGVCASNIEVEYDE